MKHLEEVVEKLKGELESSDQVRGGSGQRAPSSYGGSCGCFLSWSMCPCFSLMSGCDLGVAGGSMPGLVHHGFCRGLRNHGRRVRGGPATLVHPPWPWSRSPSTHLASKSRGLRARPVPGCLHAAPLQESGPGHLLEPSGCRGCLLAPVPGPASLGPCGRTYLIPSICGL